MALAPTVGFQGWHASSPRMCGFRSAFVFVCVCVCVCLFKHVQDEKRRLAANNIYNTNTDWIREILPGSCVIESMSAEGVHMHMRDIYIWRLINPVTLGSSEWQARLCCAICGAHKAGAWLLV